MEKIIQRIVKPIPFLFVVNLRVIALQRAEIAPFFCVIIRGTASNESKLKSLTGPRKALSELKRKLTSKTTKTLGKLSLRDFFIKDLGHWFGFSEIKKRAVKLIANKIKNAKAQATYTVANHAAES